MQKWHQWPWDAKKQDRIFLQFKSNLSKFYTHPTGLIYSSLYTFTEFVPRTAQNIWKGWENALYWQSWPHAWTFLGIRNWRELKGYFICRDMVVLVNYSEEPKNKSYRGTRWITLLKLQPIQVPPRPEQAKILSGSLVPTSNHSRKNKPTLGNSSKKDSIFCCWNILSPPLRILCPLTPLTFSVPDPPIPCCFPAPASDARR